MLEFGYYHSGCQNQYFTFIYFYFFIFIFFTSEKYFGHVLKQMDRNDGLYIQ